MKKEYMYMTATFVEILLKNVVTEHMIMMLASALIKVVIEINTACSL